MTTARGDIENAINRWCWGMDERDLELVSRCWAEDAVMHTKLPGKKAETLTGRVAILTRLSDAWNRLPPAGVKHVVTTLYIENETEETVLAHSYTVSFRLTEGRPALSSLGRHHDLFVRRAGEWLLKERTHIVDGWMAGG